MSKKKSIKVESEQEQVLDGSEIQPTDTTQQDVKSDIAPAENVVPEKPSWFDSQEWQKISDDQKRKVIAGEDWR